ncbi:hypothetical protein [Pedobacter soli]|uniref:Uncharacterized protein n=1 Tax=Pedobacter soli TaxID=390242 RepID=A0A1G7B5A6_9SPHI|nr:hypothetical protein [Pedobacter soli]SDE22027.1 hypothetical protein SAMN04488024_11430 [Pedobacter soli]
MNFDDIKNDWNNPDAGSETISASMLKVKEAYTPIDIIRKKMKHEFFYQIFFLVVMFFLPVTISFSTTTQMAYLACYAIICGFSAYYFFKFYKFYKNSYDMSMDSRKSILWFYYEMKLNIELYKALTYIVAFIAVAFGAIYILVEENADLSKILARLSPVYVLLNCFISILIIGIITELWAWYYYGKYLKRVKKVVDELDFE